MKDKSALLWGSIGASVALVLWTLTECLVFDAPDTKTQEEDEGGTELCFDQKVGNTPLVYIKSLSELTGCDIFAKMECRNPGGSGKDRPALYMLQDMACKFTSMGLDAKKSKVIESTSGNTGISLAAMCRELSLELHIVMPDDQSIEKTRKLEALGANVKVVANCAIANTKHYVNEARRMAVGPSALPQAVRILLYYCSSFFL
jgi:cysteine synthase